MSLRTVLTLLTLLSLLMVGPRVKADSPLTQSAGANLCQTLVMPELP